MVRFYTRPSIIASCVLKPQHLDELESSALDVVTAGLGGVSSINHGEAHDMGIRSHESLRGMCFRYWEPWERRFSGRFARIKPDVQVANRKYLQPVGEKPKLYFIAGTLNETLTDTSIPVFLTEGEKKSLSLDRALRTLGQPGLVVGLGGVWSWRWSPKKLKPDGKLGKRRSRPIEELDRIDWQSRTVFLVFDSDVATNWRVQAAESALARELTKRGAQVRIVRIPGDQPWAKSA